MSHLGSILSINNIDVKFPILLYWSRC